MKKGIKLGILGVVALGVYSLYKKFNYYKDFLSIQGMNTSHMNVKDVFDVGNAVLKTSREDRDSLIEYANYRNKLKNWGYPYRNLPESVVIKLGQDLEKLPYNRNEVECSLIAYGFDLKFSECSDRYLRFMQVLLYEMINLHIEEDWSVPCELEIIQYFLYSYNISVTKLQWRREDYYAIYMLCYICSMCGFWECNVDVLNMYLSYIKEM